MEFALLTDTEVKNIESTYATLFDWVASAWQERVFGV
jgi:hypothetical protein